MHPKVSVVIPAYNASQEISRPLRSLCNQTLLPEVIVVDDGSVDGTANEVRHFAENSPLSDHLTVISLPNSGVSVARNTGFSAATGDYVVFLDADDWVHPEMCSLVSEVSGTDSNPPDIVAWGWTQGTTTPTGLQGGPLSSPAIVMSGRELLRHMLSGHRSLCTGSVAYRRNFLNQLGLRYAPGCSAGEDREFIYKAVASADKTIYLDIELFCYMQTEDSLSRGVSAGHFATIAAHRRARDHIRQLGSEFVDYADEIYERYALSNFLRHLSRWLLKVPEQSVSTRVSRLEEAHPGLISEMQRVARRRCVKKILGVFRQGAFWGKGSADSRDEGVVPVTPTPVNAVTASWRPTCLLALSANLFGVTYRARMARSPGA